MPEEVECLQAIRDYIPRVERKRALHEKRRLKQVYYEVMVS